jgi:hypothetical protein
MDTPEPDDPWSIPDDALGVTTLIGRERGQWVVYLEVAFRDGVRRHRIQAYPTEAKARIAADMIRRAALRDSPFRDEAS